jgi:uncharacterized membrane protein
MVLIFIYICHPKTEKWFKCRKSKNNPWMKKAFGIESGCYIISLVGCLDPFDFSSTLSLFFHPVPSNFQHFQWICWHQQLSCVRETVESTQLRESLYSLVPAWSGCSTIKVFCEEHKIAPNHLHHKNHHHYHHYTIVKTDFLLGFNKEYLPLNTLNPKQSSFSYISYIIQ